jgi:alkylation response protein AidB-like acyl-CoA dehydrogenase
VEALNFGRFCVAWGCVGIARACLDSCLQYAKTREQFGVPLLQHQLVQEMITEMMVNTEAARLLSFQAAQSRESNHPDKILDCLSAKYFASTRAVHAANNAVQIHGALGCSDRIPVQRYLRDARMMEIIEGTTQIHQIKIAELAAAGRVSG